MKFLTGILSRLAEYQQLEKAISEHQLPAMATGLSAIHKSHLIHTICAGTGQKALVIAGDEAEGARLCSDISAMGTKAVFYPARDFTFREVTGVSREFEHQRIGALYAFSSGEAQVMICCADAAMQYTMPKDVLMKSTLEIKEGASLSMEAIMESLLAEGYVRVEQVDGTGQFAARGGILDFFMPSAPQPCRIEFWGDEIDTISSFDIETQRRTDRVDSFVITPSSEIIFHDAAALAEKILAGLEGRPPVYLRVNSTRISDGAYLKRLEQAGVKAAAFAVLSGCLAVEETGDIAALPGFAEGLFHVQDASSQLCCAMAAPEAGSVVYDVCAAPGGKSFTLAERMGDSGRVMACDLHPHRVELIAEGAKRLGLRCIEPTVRDALGECLPECADLVLCDVPCSGLGIIRRKPDIKRKAREELSGLPDVQYRILENSSRLVRKGGRLVYSTCTLHPAENLAVIARFLESHDAFEPCPLPLPEGLERAIDEPDYALTLFPHMLNTDGFFISAVRRKDGT